MSGFIWNVLLALIWTFATESVTAENFFIGLLLSYVLLMFAQPVFGESSYFQKLPKATLLAVLFVWELVRANLRVAHDVITPTSYMHPGIIAFPLDAETDYEITMLSMFISLTPGTLSLDVSPDRKVLYIHGMFADDPDELRREIKHNIERRILEVMR